LVLSVASARAATLENSAKAEAEVVLYKAAPHPNAGKLLISFILSVEGQRMLREQRRIPGHRDVDPQVFSLRNVKLHASDHASPKNMAPPAKRCVPSSAHDDELPV